MTELNLNPTRMNLSANEVLFSGEAPQDLLGLSIIIKDLDPLDYEIYIKRVLVHPRKKLKKQVGDLIKDLRDYAAPPAMNFSNSVEKEWKKNAKNGRLDLTFAKKNPPPIIVGNSDGTTQQFQNKLALLEVFRPTLFVFTTNVKDATFIDTYIQPKIPSIDFDPHWSRLRFWKNDKVMGVYSSYRAGQDSRKSEYWYDLDFGFTKKNSPVAGLALNLGDLIDPGTGNGGGNEFP